MNVVTDATGIAVRLEELDADWLLVLAEDAEVQCRGAERNKLRLAAQWCALHEVDDRMVAAHWSDAGGQHTGIEERLGGDGTPMIREFTAEPFATALGISTTAAMQLLSDVLNLQHRLPQTHAKVEHLEVAPWKARRVAQATQSLSKEAAGYVDAKVAPIIDCCGPTRLGRIVDEAAAKFDPIEQQAAEDEATQSWGVELTHATLAGWVGTSRLEITGDTPTLTRFRDLLTSAAHDLLDAGRPADQQAPLGHRQIEALQALLDGLLGTGGGAKTKLFVHCTLADLLDPTTHLGSVERLGPLSLAAIRGWVGSTRCTITPVLDLGRTDAVNEHDPPAWMHELVVQRDPSCVFPWCDRDSRSCDLDHIKAYLDMLAGGPPGQTSPRNLAPLCRRHHRLKTHGRWRYHPNTDGTYTWHSPHGPRYTVAPEGTVHVN